MTSRELEILNSIHQSGGRCSLRKINKATGLSLDYAFLISKVLLKRGLIKKNGQNVFILTNSGRLLVDSSRDDLEESKPSTLIKVARSFGNEVKLLLLEPEINFIKREFTREYPRLAEHNLSKGTIIEVANAGLIQKSIQRLSKVEILKN